MWKQETLQEYIPSSIEKKRAVVMYMFFWIMVAISMENMSDFEYWHLKQAVWRWILFILVLILGSILLFLPIINLLFFLIIFVFVIVWWLFIYYSWNGKPAFEITKWPIYLFAGVWEWCLDLFDLKLGKKKLSQDSEEDDIQKELMN